MTIQRGLRDRKKTATRAHIAEVATELFLARGFDAVTVTDIATAAGVAKMTVFNHFARKEDLFFDRIPEARRLLEHAVRDRPAGVSVLAAVRGLLIGLTETGHPLGGVGEGHRRFWAVVHGSPALQGRAREISGELEALLADLIRAAHGAAPTDPGPGITAGLVVGAVGALQKRAVLRLLAADPVDDVRTEQCDLLRHLFDRLECASPDVVRPTSGAPSAGRTGRG